MTFEIFKIIFLTTMLALSVKFAYRSIITVRWRQKLKNITALQTQTSVSIIIPVRNEALNIRECLESLQKLSYDTDKLEIIVVDDGSTDNTADIISEFTHKNSTFRLINAPVLPDGWMGKNHACFIGAKEAKNDILLFIDADVRLLPNSLLKTTAYMVGNDVKMLSLTPSQLIESIGERLLLPGIFLSISESINFYEINNQHSKKAIANGQFMMFDKKSYFAFGGHERVRDILSEDIALARLHKELGIKSAVVIDDGSLATVRMYRSFLESWRGFSKNLSEIVGADNVYILAYQMLRSLVFGVGAWWLLYLCFTQNDYLACAFAVTLWSIFIGTVLVLKIPIYYTATVPLGFIGYSYLIVDNYIKRKIKGAREWKGRRY